MSADGVRYAHRVFSLMFDLAVRDGRIGRNPATGVSLPRAVRRTPVFLTVDQLGRLVAAAGEDGPSIRFLALTGLRFGEFAALRCRHVDLARRRLTVSESVTEVGGRMVWSSTKNHKTRLVPIAASLAADLATRCEGRQPDDPVFTAPQGGPLRINNWRPRVFDPACAAAGIEGLSPHDLRHTAASLAVSAGANVKAVQRMLGHASAAMTLDVYAGLFADDLDDVAARLDLHVPSMCPPDLTDPSAQTARAASQGPDLR
jgi:integrase